MALTPAREPRRDWVSRWISAVGCWRRERGELGMRRGWRRSTRRGSVRADFLERRGDSAREVRRQVGFDLTLLDWEGEQVRTCERAERSRVGFAKLFVGGTKEVSPLRVRGGARDYCKLVATHAR